LLLVVAVSCGDGDKPADTQQADTTAPGGGQEKVEATAEPTAVEKIEKKEAAPAGGPKYGGIIPVYQTSFDPPSLDPLSESPFQFLVPVVGIYNNLLREDPDGSGKVIGDLAKDWKTSGDGLVTTFFLREGVKFHDGTPFTAADVKASLDKIIDPDFRSPRGGGLLKPLIESVTVEDELTVVVTSKFPTPLLIPSLASDWVKILKADIVNDPERDTSDPALVIGTGPFIFKEWNRGSGVTWEKNPNYFEEGFPYLDGMEMFFMSDLATVMSSFLTKRVLVWGNIPVASPENIQDIENQIGKENFGIKELGIATTTMFLNTQKPPFDDPKIRSAVWLILDREQMDIRANGRLIEGHISGHALNLSMSPAFSLPIEEVSKIPGIPKPTDEDIARAKELMAEAGKPDGFETSCTTDSRDFTNIPMQIATFAMEKHLNIKCKGGLVSEQTGQLLAKGAAGDFEASIFATAGTIADADNVLGLLWTKGGGRNYSKWSDPEFERIFAAQKQELDPVKRKEMMYQLQRIVMQPGQGNIPLDTLPVRYMWWTTVKNWNFTQTIYDNRRWDRVWLDPG